MRGIVMDRGRRTAPSPTLSEMADHCAEQLRRLPAGSLRLVNPHRYKVSMSGGLHRLRSRLMEQVEEHLSAPAGDGI